LFFICIPIQLKTDHWLPSQSAQTRSGWLITSVTAATGLLPPACSLIVHCSRQACQWPVSALIARCVLHYRESHRTSLILADVVLIIHASISVSTVYILSIGLLAFTTSFLVTSNASVVFANVTK